MMVLLHTSSHFRRIGVVSYLVSQAGAETVRHMCFLTPQNKTYKHKQNLYFR